MDYLAELNPAQREAATHLHGPLLIIAGAGAGKTKTITHRIGHLIASGVEPGAILAVTFTNKAAKEMRERVMSLLGSQSNQRWERERPFVSTFHSLGVQILRADGRALGYTKSFTILDKEDSLSILKEAMKELGIDDKRWPPRRLSSVISREKGKLVSQTDFASAPVRGPLQAVVGPVWQRYETKLRERQALDFDDLITQTVRLFETNPAIRQAYQQRWPYVHIDEYQDTNAAQYRLTELLVGPAKNICVVGDGDQSIYGWRGADYTNILNFERDYPTAKVVTLEENYRSTQNILETANRVIQKNQKRREKNLFTKNAIGEKITVASCLDENAEATYVANAAKEAITSGTPAGEIAVLYRANFQSRALEEAFVRVGVPYQVLGTRFFERKEVKDVLALLKTALNPEDRESWKRMINVPPRGIGKVTIAKVLSKQMSELPLAMQTKIAAVQALLADLKEKSLELPPSKLVKYALDKSGIAEFLREGSEEDRERLENLQELVTIATKYDNLPPEDGLLALIADGALMSDQDTLDEAEPGVRLMTVHAAKGLEFDTVFVTGLEQDLFPHRALASDADRDDEEERRLFYVAVTRARKKLYLTYASVRTIFGSRMVTIPSEFIIDLDDDLIESAIGSNEEAWISID